jgi:acyl carrier protein
LLKTTNARAVVVNTIQELLSEADLDTTAVSGEASLGDLGLSSLMLARLILALEDELSADPFDEDTVFADINTVDDLVAAYEKALSNGDG